MANGRLLWLPAALKNAGLRVNVVGGWETRGQPQMHPRVIVLHHTAGPRRGNAPSLRVCIEGRADLPGPLCHVLIGRDGTCHVIASGRAHHAGVGSWLGVTGNSNAIGIEVENVGTNAEPWRPELVDVMVRAAAACASEADLSPRMVCGHKEWAPRRKVDPHTLDMSEIRHLIAAQGDDMPLTDDDIRKVADAVWNRTLTREGVGMNAPATLVVGDIFWHARKAAGGADVDEVAIATEILQHLDAGKIAAAIPDDLAEKVADELAARLAG